MMTPDAAAAHPDASTGLLAATERTTSYSDSCSDDNNSVHHDAAEENEANTPWPATFERSVALLSKPVPDRRLVASAAEGMRALPPTTLKRNTSLTHLNRGWRTPDPSPVSKWLERRSEGPEEYDDEEERGASVFQRMGLTKTLTMDWRFRFSQERPIVTEGHLQPTKSLAEARTEIEHGEARGTDAEAVEAPKATFRQCVFNTTNTLMGMGIISLPYCLRTAGWFGGLSSILVFGAVTWWTSILIGRSLNGDPRPRSLSFEDKTTAMTADNGGHKDADRKGVARLRRQLTSFPDIAREAFGQRVNVVLSSVLYFELFSALAMFFVSLGDHLHYLMPSIRATHHMAMMAVLLVVPTVLCKTPRLVSYLSAVGTFTTVVLVVSVIFAAVREGDIAAEMAAPQDAATVAAPPSFHSVFIAAGLPTSLGLVAFCFGGHAVVPSIYDSMARPRDYERMIGYSYALVTSCCILVAVSGYYMFGATVCDQITLSLARAPLERAGPAARALTWLMVVTSFSKMTLYLFPLALGAEELLAPRLPAGRATDASFTAIKLSLIAASLLVGIWVPSFAFLCSVVGLVCTMIVSVIFPAAAHLKLFSSSLRDGEKVVDYLLIVGGSCVAIFGTVATMRSLVQP